MKTDELNDLARKLYKHYHAKLISETPYMGTVSYSFEPLEAQPKKVIISFQKAAMSCAGVGAKPREWIDAQFAKFEEYEKFVGKPILPQPTQLFGLNAQARYVAWKKEKLDDDRREKRKANSAIHDSVVIDERTLKNLMRSMRLPETDVLVEKPDEFSVAFLKQKGVWDVVKKRRRELRGEA